jgi:NTE family protein
MLTPASLTAAATLASDPGVTRPTHSAQHGTASGVWLAVSGSVSEGRTAFVLGGGGVLGSAQVGMLQALLEKKVSPDLIVASSVGALNGLVVAANPSCESVSTLRRLWEGLQARDVFSSTVIGQVTNLVRHGTHLHSNLSLRRLLSQTVGERRIEDMPVHFECVAACIENAAAYWFDHGPAADAVLASCAVPGLLPPVSVDGLHYMDGGLVASVPVGRAVLLGARRVFVLQVGRIERKLAPPSRPWEVAAVAFEIARRHQFADDMARLPTGVDVHVLPAGDGPGAFRIRYRSTSAVRHRMEIAYAASNDYLETLSL